MQPVATLILPGLGSSGPDHWQTHWEREHGYVRVEQRDWDQPSLDDWLTNLKRAVRAQERPVVLVAHSLACSLVAHFAAEQPSQVLGALLVSPADVDSEHRTPPEVRGFAPMPLTPLPFPALVVASSDDPFVCSERAAFFAQSWGAEFANIGPAGHINASSKLGAWPEGHHRLQASLARWIS